MTNTTDQTQARAASPAKQPNFVVKQRIGFGKNVSYERLGAAWLNDDGSVYVKLTGKQFIDGGFTLYEIASNDAA